MNVKLFIAGLLDSMLRDHVPPQEIIGATSEIMSQVARQTMNMHTWMHAFSVNPETAVEDQIKDLAQHFGHFMENMKHAGADSTLLRSVALNNIANSVVAENVTEEQWLEIAKKSFSQAKQGG